MAGLTDLDELLRSMAPVVRDGEYVVVSLPEVGDLPAEATVREDEGITVVLRRETADAAGLAYDLVAGWITLTVHSSLEAVGLTAAFATALTEAGISCNVLAGAFHDHLLVPVGDVARAVEVLRRLGDR